MTHDLGIGRVTVPRRWLRDRGLLFGALLTLVAGHACQAPQASPEQVPADTQQPDPALPNVIIILTDTARADRYSAYGAPRPTTPFFDRFAARGYLFERAYAPTSWTRPSVATLFTGAFPQRHGVQMRQDILPSEIPTLAEVMQQAGWHTTIVNTNPHVTDTWGMTRGFDQAVHLMPHPDQFKAGNGASVVLQHLRRIQGSFKEPFLLYVHLIDPHYPYEPPERDLRALGITAKEPSSLARYDAEIHYTDRHIQLMTELFHERGWLDDSVVILTSDHGEEFMEHGSTGHGKTLYQEVVHVPLAMQIPQGLQHRVRDPRDATSTCARISHNVSLADLLPTVLDLLELEIPSPIDGESLLPLLRCEQAPHTRPLYFSVEKERTSHAGVLVDQSKLLVDRTSGSRRLYLLDENPQEQSINLMDRPGMPALRKRLGDLLEAYEWSVRPGLHVELAGRDNEKDRRRMVLTLTTTGKFSQVVTHNFEPGDKWTLSKDGKRLRINTRLTSFWHRSPKHVWVQDRDELQLQLEPEDAEVSVRLELDGEPAPRPQLRFPSVPGKRWPVTLRHHDLISSDGLVDRRAPGVYLYLQSRTRRRALETVSAEITDALRALGYLQ